MRVLEIELVPETCWGVNLRSRLPIEAWDIVRKKVYRDCNYRCAICGGKGDRWPVEAHEVWEYDDENLIQKLVRIDGLCPACHEAHHYGLAQTRGRDDIVERHLMKINNWTGEQVREHVRESFKLWEWRSKQQWQQDLSALAKYGKSILSKIKSDFR